jgi:hypothetical protein
MRWRQIKQIHNSYQTYALILDAELHNQPVPDDLTMSDFIAGEDVEEWYYSYIGGVMIICFHFSS